MDTNAIDLLTNLSAQPVNKTISVSLPAQVYFDLDQFQQVQKNLLSQLGCPCCTSGFDIRYAFQRRFVVDNRLAVTALELPQATLTP